MISLSYFKIKVAGNWGQWTAWSKCRGNVEDLRIEAGFVILPDLIMGAQTVEANCLRVRRETALNVKISP